MRKVILSTIISLLCLTVKAQLEVVKFGDIDLKDLQMTVYPEDSSADAVFLVRKGRSQLRGSDFKMFVDFHIRIKILTEKGLDRASVVFNYIKGSSDIKNFKGATYNLVDGQVETSSVSKSDQIRENNFDSNWQLRVAFPKVKVGSIIEYSFRQVRGDVGYLPGWWFQVDLPVRYSEYWIEIPKYGSYQPSFQGFQEPVYINNSVGVYHIAFNNVPALIEEPYVATIENYRAKIDFEVKSITIPGYGRDVHMQDWEQINDQLLKNERFGRVLKQTKRMEENYPGYRGWTNNEASLKEIYEYVRDHYTWNDKYRFTVTNSLRSIWKEGEGTSAEINFSLLQFLELAGIKSWPVLISTRDQGFVKQELPLVNQFNSVLVHALIGEKHYLLDATNPILPYNVLTPELINGIGFEVNPDGWQWINLHANREISQTEYSLEIEINDQGFVSGKTKNTFQKSAAGEFRESFSSAEDFESEEEFFAEVENLTISNIDKPNLPVEVSYDYFFEDEIEAISGNYYFNPFLIKVLEKNPFIRQKRVYPVDLNVPENHTLFINLKLPENYVIEEVPKSESLSLPNGGGRYIFNVSHIGQQVAIMMRFSLNKLQYTIQEYDALRALAEQILKDQESLIVIKKP